MLIKNPSKWTRRSLLAGAGGAALLPFVPMLESHAGGLVQPRFLVFFHAHGMPRAAWSPTGTQNNWQLGEVLQPLAPFKDRISIVEGLTNAGGAAGGEQGHVDGQRTILNNTRITADNQPGGISIDQAIANHIGDDTPFRSLEAGVYGNHQGLNATGFRQAMETEEDPRALFDRVFANASLDDGLLDKLRADRGSVIDLVRSNLRALESRVSATDRVKIEQHLDHVRTIEEGLATLGEIPGGCVIPDPPNLDGQGPSSQYRDVAHLHADLIAAAMACDMTRVATLALYTVQIRLDYLPGVNDTCHRIHHDGANPNSGVFHERFKTLTTEYASLFGYLLERLDAFVDPDGSTVLDNSMLVWTTYYPGGNHGHDDLAFVLAGGAGGAIETDRWLTYDGNPTGQLWTSMGRTMGMDIDSFGEHGAPGPLPGL